MHGIGLDYPLSKWFDFSVPRTSVKPNYIENVLGQLPEEEPSENSIVLWMPNAPYIERTSNKAAKGNLCGLIYSDRKKRYKILTSHATAVWLCTILQEIRPFSNNPIMTFGQFKTRFNTAALDDYEDFRDFTASFTWQQLKAGGLLLV
jgi:hypothetical protein